MDATLYDIRLARPDDLESLRTSVRKTLNNPEGKSQRKKFADAIERGELLVLTHRERGAEAVEGFVEWHSRVDGGITIRDAGWAGDEPNPGNVKRLLRELLLMARPPVASVKVEAENQPWDSLFGETLGFRLEGREYSQRKWRHIWSWTPQDDQLDRQRAASQRAPARPAPLSRPPGAPPPPRAGMPPRPGGPPQRFAPSRPTPPGAQRAR
jgi:hypothetical protein